MSSKRAGQSPRVKAHSLKVTGSSKKLKKKSSSRAFVDTMESVTSIDDYDNTVRPMDRSITSLAEEKSVSQLMKSTTGHDVLQLQMQLAKAMDDTSILRSRLRAELEHRQVLENKITDLTEKLSEARRGLAETKGALNKVQTVASQLITKRDEREVQLQQALDQNGIYERKIAELEMHISHLSLVHEQNSNTSVEKTIQSMGEKEKHLNEVLAEMKEKLLQSRKDFIRVQEEKESLEFMLESKKKRIQMLEEQISRMSEGGLSAEALASTRDSLLLSMWDITRAQTAKDSSSSLGSPVNMRGSVANSNSIAAAIASAVAAANAPAAATTDVTMFESKISNLESDKKSLEERLLHMEKQFVEQQKMQLAQQQLQMQQQQKIQQQMQMQMQMAQQQAMMVQAGTQNPGSAVPMMRNSGSRASNVRLNGTVTPTSQPMMMPNSIAPLVDATTRLTSANSISNSVTPGTIPAAATSANFATAFTPSASIAASPTANTNAVNYTSNFNSNNNGNNMNGSATPAPAAMLPQITVPPINTSNNVNPDSHNYNNNNNNKNNQSSVAVPVVNSQPTSVPQKSLAEAEAQAVLREILSSRERQRPRTVERPRSNDDVNVPSSHGAAENAGNAPARQSSRVTRDSIDRNAGGDEGANRPMRQSSRATTRESIERSQRGTSSRSSTRANPNLPVQNQTPNFNNQQLSESPRNDPVLTALENTQKAYANNGLENKPFEANVRDESTTNAQVRPTMSRLASRYIKSGDDPEVIKARLNDEKKSCKKKIVDWMKTFQQENSREPTKEEREGGAGVWYKEYRQISKVLKELEGGNGRASLSMPDMDED